MSTSVGDRADKQREMFGGYTLADLRKVAFEQGPAVFAMSLMSDAQAEIAIGHSANLERARRMLNAAKYVVDQFFNRRNETPKEGD